MSKAPCDKDPMLHPFNHVVPPFNPAPDAPAPDAWDEQRDAKQDALTEAIKDAAEKHLGQRPGYVSAPERRAYRYGLAARDAAPAPDADGLIAALHGPHGSGLLDRLGGAQKMLDGEVPMSDWVCAQIDNEAAAWIRKAAALLAAQAAQIAEWKRKYGDASEWGLRNAAAWKHRAERAEAERDKLLETCRLYSAIDEAKVQP